MDFCSVEDSKACANLALNHHTPAEILIRRQMLIFCRAMSLSVTAYAFPWGRGVLLLEPIPALRARAGCSLDKSPAHRRALTDQQCGVQYFAQGHFNMQLSPARSRDLNQRPSDQ